MRLINGRGQLGEALAKLDVPDDAIVYHTWNVDDKGEAAQRSCYERFAAFRDNNAGWLVLISTSSDNDNAYVAYKRQAERLSDGVVRLPTLIGRGICERFRDDPATSAWGEMEVLSIKEAAQQVAGYVRAKRADVFSVPGTKIPADVVQELIRFGARDV